MKVPEKIANRDTHIQTPTSNQVADEGQAVRMVASTIKSHKLAVLAEQCINFRVSDSDPNTYHIDVRERHNAECGGDPQTAPRVFSFIVDKHSGKMTTDARSAGQFEPIQ